MFFDTHCHLNFQAFIGGERKILQRARDVGVGHILIPGTDRITSQIAVDIADRLTDCYAAVGIHPHHLYPYIGRFEALEKDIYFIEQLLTHPTVVAIGEIGLDRHTYRVSKYGPDIAISDEYIEMQIRALEMQIHLAIRHDKSVVIHNRETTSELLHFFTHSLTKDALLRLQDRLVIHCCEPDQRLLDLAVSRRFFIGVDGDITYDAKKQDFIRTVPLSHLVLETDSPYILPEPLRSQKKYPNVPANIPLIAQAVAEVKAIDLDEVASVTTANAHRLYHLPKEKRKDDRKYESSRIAV